MSNQLYVENLFPKCLLLSQARNCCFGDDDGGPVVKVQPPPREPSNQPRQVPYLIIILIILIIQSISFLLKKVPYLPGESTASGRDVFLVEGPVTLEVNGQVMTGE